MEKKYNFQDTMKMKDMNLNQHGFDKLLRGEIELSRVNKITGEKEFLERSHNVIVISGYQWLLMKMFGLYLDSDHNNGYEQLDQNTNLIIPDLNKTNALPLGVDPIGYSPMTENIASNHFVQGFMIGCGGSGEDAITTKNTDYSFINLREPIPFQQTQTSLDPTISSQYLGELRMGSTSFSHSYYIKKFDSTPRIFHSWWRDGQKWDYVDSVVPGDLGPRGNLPKTNRIETYAQVEMSIDTDAGDCISYFSHDGNTQPAVINELGLVAFDTLPGTRTIITKCYHEMIKQFIRIIFDQNSSEEDLQNAIVLATNILTVLEEQLSDNSDNVKMNQFIQTLHAYVDAENMLAVIPTIQDALGDGENNIGVEVHYNQNHVYLYETDHFLELINSSAFSQLTDDKAQRIKLITYYTFNSIPLQTNWKILINYRIYAN